MRNNSGFPARAGGCVQRDGQGFLGYIASLLGKKRVDVGYFLFGQKPVLHHTIGKRQVDLLLLAQAFLDGVENVSAGGVVFSERVGIDETRLDGDRSGGDVVVRKVSPANRIIFDRYRLN